MLWRKSFLCGVIPTGRKSQRKGADGERELAALLREYGYPVERGGSLSFGEVPDLTGLPGVHIECKRAEQLRPYSWLEQAERDALRREYIDAVLGNLKRELDNTYVVDEQGHKTKLRKKEDA